jgi:hypothetical protein
MKNITTKRTYTSNGIFRGNNEHVRHSQCLLLHDHEMTSEDDTSIIILSNNKQQRGEGGGLLKKAFRCNEDELCQRQQIPCS